MFFPATKRPTVTADRYAALFHRAFALGDDAARLGDRLAGASPAPTRARALADLRALGEAIAAFGAVEPADPALRRFHRWPPRYLAHRHALFVATVVRREPATAAQTETEIACHERMVEAAQRGVRKAIVGLYKRSPGAYHRLGLTARELGAFDLCGLFTEPGAAGRADERPSLAPVDPPGEPLRRGARWA